MAKIESVAAYIGAQPVAKRPALRRVRAAIRKALPSAQETVSYGIPAYRADGKTVIYFAAWKDHYSLYPVGRAVQSAFRADLEDHQIKGSTLRISFSVPVPARLIGQIAIFKSKSVSATRKRGASRPAKKRRT